MTDNTIMEVYNSCKKQAVKEGYGFTAFWHKVCFFTDPLNSDAASWAIAAKLALKSLREEKYD